MLPNFVIPAAYIFHMLNFLPCCEKFVDIFVAFVLTFVFFFLFRALYVDPNSLMCTAERLAQTKESENSMLYIYTIYAFRAQWYNGYFFFFVFFVSAFVHFLLC